MPLPPHTNITHSPHSIDKLKKRFEASSDKELVWDKVSMICHSLLW